MLSCCGNSARREERRKARARKPLKMDPTQVEVGEDGEGLDRTLGVGTDIYVPCLVLRTPGLSLAWSPEGSHLLGGNCFFRPRDALRGSKLVEKASDGSVDRKLDDGSRSSDGFCKGSERVSEVKFLRAFKQRLHIAGLDMRRRVRVNWRGTSLGAILKGYKQVSQLQAKSQRIVDALSQTSVNEVCELYGGSD
jgi:hypothetical protein